MAGLDRPLGRAVVANFDKPESSRLASKSVSHDCHRIYRDSCLREEILDIGFIRAVRQVSYKQFLH